MECPRKGYVRLVDADHEHVMKTSCKTWRCKACQKRLARYYELRILYGSSRVESSLLITITYEMGKRGSVGALSAVADLRKLWQRLRSRGRWKNVAWCRVTELTKKGQVHHHLVIGGVRASPRCLETVFSRNKGYQAWYWAGCLGEEDCLNHELAREWHRITGDSNVVDVENVLSHNGVSVYLGKYLTKGMAMWDTLEGLGFKRRFNCSRNWPSPGRLRLSGSEGEKESEWDWVERMPMDPLARVQGLAPKAREVSRCVNMQRVGIDMTEVYRVKRSVRKIEEMLTKGSVG